MVNDILENIKAELENYQKVITETENMQLRQAIQDIRDNNESFQYELFKVAQIKGYYIPTFEAKQTEIDKIKNEFDS